MEPNKLNSRQTDWESIAIPVILMVTGIVLLGGNFLGFLSLARIQNLWPEAVIAIGVIELLPWCSKKMQSRPAPAETANEENRRHIGEAR